MQSRISQSFITLLLPTRLFSFLFSFRFRLLSKMGPLGVTLGSAVSGRPRNMSMPISQSMNAGDKAIFDF